MHGKDMELPTDGDVFNIATPRVLPFKMDDKGLPLPTSEIPYRVGSYSRVGKSQDFEWDGWRP